MGLKKLGANAACGCGSGKKYKRCCQPDDVAWYIDERGVVIDHIAAEIHEKARAALGTMFQKRYGRPARLGIEFNEVYTSMTKLERIDYFMGVGLPSEVIYAYEQTDTFMPWKWWRFFEATGVIPIQENGEPSVFAPALEAILEYRRIAAGDDAVPEPERLTIKAVIDIAKEHAKVHFGASQLSVDKSGSMHMMVHHTDCRGCRCTLGLIELLRGDGTGETGVSPAELLLVLLDDGIAVGDAWSDDELNVEASDLFAPRKVEP